MRIRTRTVYDGQSSVKVRKYIRYVRMVYAFIHESTRPPGRHASLSMVIGMWIRKRTACEDNLRLKARLYIIFVQMVYALIPETTRPSGPRPPARHTGLKMIYVRKDKEG
jgi:hypothetical protein